MVKVLPSIFQECLRRFTMLLLEGSTETELFRDLSSHVFRSPSVQKYISFVGHAFFEIVENWMYILKTRKNNWQKVFCLWDNCIWRCCNKLCLLRREYLSSAVNVLTNSPNSFHITKRDFYNWIYFTVINNFGKGTVVQISKVFRPVHHVTFRRILWNGIF